MDKIDRKILREMQADASLSAADIASRVGLSHTPCWRRIKKLEESDVVRGRAILLNAAALGLAVSVFAELRLKQHDEQTLEALELAVRQRDEIVECFSMSGDSDYLLRIVIESVEAYERFIKKVLLHLPGVSSINSQFALGCIKMTTCLPISE